MELSTSVAFVTGANRGLGRHLAEQLAAAGARVYGGARRPETMDTTHGVIPVQLDITDPVSVATAARIAADTTLLINNAGMLTPTSMLTSDRDAIAAEFDTNFFGPLNMTRAFARGIERNGGGTVLNILSVLSWLVAPTMDAYSAAKAASWSATNALRVHLAPMGIRVSALHVGSMDTDMLKHLDVPKSTPASIAAAALAGVANDEYEIVADEFSQQIRQGLAVGVSALYPDLP
jgi:NAD(P)-dependent dehydrogenase (short-subunit alcohol dehydrogenase family)